MPGRLPKHRKKRHKFSIRLDDYRYMILEDLMKINQSSASDVIRDAIVVYRVVVRLLADPSLHPIKELSEVDEIKKHLSHRKPKG